MTAKTMGPNLGAMSPQTYQRGCSDVDRALALKDGNRLKEQSVQNGIHDVVKQVGELQIAAAQQGKEEGQKKIDNSQAKMKASDEKLATACHNILVKTLGKMIFDAVKQTPASPQNASETPAARAKNIAEGVILKYESQKTPGFLELIQAKGCMKLTPSVASAIKDILSMVPNCTNPDLTMFNDQIDSQALKGILLSTKQVSKIVFAASVKGTAVEQVALEVKRTRQLEIAFV